MAEIPQQVHTMPDIRLIALDLDGTLLDSDKNFSQRNLNALTRAAEKGIYIVMSTGRFYNGMPEVIRKLPFVRYVITINGAGVFDVAENREIYQALIPCEQAIALYQKLDEHDLIYDCYQDNWGWMSDDHYAKSAQYTDDVHYQKMLRELRSPVGDLKQYLMKKNRGIQKMQFFTRDMAFRREVLDHWHDDYPELLFSSSTANNVEINNIRANKGDAMEALGYYLGIGRREMMAFGDGLNDLSMIRQAGFGVVMKNGADEVKQVADIITGTNDEDGVAAIVEKYCL